LNGLKEGHFLAWKILLWRYGDGEKIEPTLKKREGTETVDGKNPAQVGRHFISLFTGSYTSQVVQDFFHHQDDTVS